MATLYLVGGVLEFGWKVTGVTSTTSVIAIFDRPFSSGGTSQPAGLIDSTTKFPMNSYRYKNASSGNKKIHFGGKNKQDGRWWYFDWEEVYVEDKEELIKIPEPRFSYKPGRTSCEISWSRPTGATTLYYKVWPYGGSEPSYSSVDAYNESKTISGLVADTTYKIKAYYGTNQSEYEESDEMFDSSAFTTISLPTFAWGTRPSSNKPFSITKTDWDNLQDTIDKRRDYARTWQYKAARGKPLTADMWNEVIKVLRNCSVTGIPGEVQPGSTCWASIFNDLATCVNKIKPN